MPDGQPSLTQQAIWARTDRDEPRDDASPEQPEYRTGVDLVDCVLGCGGKTRNPMRECDHCVRAHNERELNHRGWQNTLYADTEGWE